MNPITPAECAAMIKKARKIAVLTGAGMSTAAGIPDFRGPNGLYVTGGYDADKIFDIHYFDRDPLPYFNFSRDFRAQLDKIEPTFTHKFLAELEQRGMDIAIITQNIDGLHQRAGSKRVLPVHGDSSSSRCRRCRKFYDGETYMKFLREQDIPTCEDCGGVIKPDVVFFGENVRHLGESEQIATDSDLMFVLGSSLTVYPAAALPSYAGGDVVIVNKGPLAGRVAHSFYLADSDLDEFFEAVAKEMESA